MFSSSRTTPGDAFLITEFLTEEESQAFEVTHVDRLEAAVHSADERDFAVVLLDLGLPDSAGLETLRTMRSRKPDLPVVVITGNSDDHLALIALREGAQDYVVKNEISGELLRRVLKYALERHQSLVRLREQEEQLRQAQKMEAIGQLAGGIAHDFNNLLNVIIGYSELVLCRAEAQIPELRNEVLQIQKAAERASGLTRQILAFSRRQALRPAVISINDVLEQMEPLLRRTLSEDIALVTSLHPDAGHTEVDVHQFEQVLMNLALNARDAMPNGGRLVVETGRADLDSEWCLAHGNAEPGSYVTLTVADNGTGMDKVTRSRVFEPFFTTKALGQGTGLGLSTVYGIVKQSGGIIDLVSEPGQGTVFTVYLPRVTKPVSAAPAAAQEVSSLPCAETILVVEDEPALRDLIAQVLGRIGYKVIVAGDG